MSADGRHTITVFLSSPGDVSQEREIVAATIRSLNDEFLGRLGLAMVLVSSDTVLPDAGHPQTVINKQTPPYDLFIGLMWSRFGTPTERAGSGTEQELREALSRRTIAGADHPRILLYFCDRPVPFPKHAADLRQLEQVVAFRNECRSRLLYSTFDDARMFERLIRRHLVQFALDRWSPAAESAVDAPQVNDAVRHLEDKFKRLFWIGYAPIEFDPEVGRYPDASSIEADLRALIGGPIEGIITFGSEQTLSNIPAIAKAVGIRGVIMGVYDPTNTTELNAAVAARKSVDGYCVGHLGLREGRYEQARLEEAIRMVRERSGKPVSTTEALEDLVAYEGLGACVDWLFPDVHQYWHEGASPNAALADLVRTRDAVRQVRVHLGAHRPVLMKMLSYPSAGGSGLTPEAQREFFDRMLRMLHDDVSGPGRLYASFFAAFDNDWKTRDRGWSPPELSTGLYDLARSPKPAVSAFINQRRRAR
ncbi:MAG: hypothetical protein HYS05_05215 [Acidobacteria bacterium]|nr:hypothetical protein [Acidobacteriota bacterium]